MFHVKHKTLDNYNNNVKTKDYEQQNIDGESSLYSRFSTEGHQLKNPACLQIMVDELYEIYKNKGITKIVGIESRGFVMASALAVKLGAGVVLARKPGKLPAATVQESYAKEYGTDTIEIHEDAINDKDIVLLHDDLLATGGTMRAACNLVKKFNPKGIMVNFLIEITDEGLHGRDVFDDVEVTTLITV